MADKGPSWRDDSAFGELDESWTPEVPATSVAGPHPLGEQDCNRQADRETSSSSSTGAATKSNFQQSTAMLPYIHVEKRRRPKGRNKGTGGASDSELLQAGPSSPTLRIASHKRSASDEQLQRAKPKPIEWSDRGSPEPSLTHHSAIERLSTSSEEKRGSHTSTVVGEGEDESTEGDGDGKWDDRTEDQEEDFGSAREEQSTSQAVTSAEEATFIEHAGVESVPPPPGWRNQRNLFTQPRLQLQAMFERSIQDVDVRGKPNGPTDSDTGVQVTGKDGGDGKVKDEGHGTVGVMEVMGEDVRELSGGRVAENSTETSRDWSDEQPEGRPVDGQLTAPHDQPPLAPTNTSSRQEDSNEREERETERVLAQVPQYTFTFASPVEARPKAVPPVTPSHSPLQLLPRGGTQNAEIEQILNTPRSERRGDDARKLVSRLVEQDRGERERKRLRLDQLPSGLPTTLFHQESNVAGQSAVDETRPEETDMRPRDYVRDAPAFMEKLKNIRFPRDISSRVSASSTGNRQISASSPGSRRGAKAPTPDSSLRGGPARRLGKWQSPRKMIRLWSAANQVDEEIEEERREAEAAGEEWQDIPDVSPVERSPPYDVPIVSIEPPTQKGLVEIVSAARETRQPGMLHIGPEDVDTEEMEHMAQGRMTFDRAMGKWVPSKTEKWEGGSRIESSDDSSDPFRDIESFASTSVVKRVQLHAPRSQSALRNEVQMSDTTATTTQANESLSEASSQVRHLALPKTPQALSMSHRSPTPRSILKTARSLPLADATSPRSISFADGQGAHPHAQQRVEKVEELLRQLAQLALGPDDSVEEIEARQETPTRKLNFNSTGSTGARSPWNLSSLRGKRSGEDIGNVSFLTNASFNVAHDRILELITDVAPWEPGWQSLKQIDLSRRRVDNLIRLKEFLPSLEEAVLDENEISYLTGLPSSLRSLSLANNRLPPTVSFGHLMNLESLDISVNQVDDSLRSLKQLVHLRHLRAESNAICSLEGIQHLSKLESINLRENRLQAINVLPGQWPRLKDLVLSRNDIVTVRGLSHLKHLRCLNLDHNRLSRIDLGASMSHLRQLRLSGNVHLASLDVGPAMNLRTLYADDCSLQEVRNIDRLLKLDNLSLRQQNGDGYGINWPAHQTRDVKRLFLSGNAFRSIDLTNRTSLSAASMTKFYSMVYLELSACQLSSLPLDLADLVPNLRHLNADYNLFESLPALHNLHRLKRFSVIGCRINKSRMVVESLNGCGELVVLDVRMNPCTMGLYPPLLLTSPPPGLHKVNNAFLPPLPNPAIARPDLGPAMRAASSEEPLNKSFFNKRTPAPDLSPVFEHDSQRKSQRLDSLFVASDDRFCRTLPAQYRLQRLLHRGALAMACPNLTWLDGLLVDEEEVRQADDYFKGRVPHPHSPGSETTSSGSSKSARRA